jgi:anti-sigma regulatory factor (Ser/Thr protein kinase)
LDEPSGFQISLSCAAASAREARRCVNRLSHLLPSEALADLRTVVTELVVNCVVHGGEPEIELAIDVAPDGWVRGTVATGGTGRVAISAPRPAGEGGLGLRIVEAITSRWGVNSPSSDVWFELAPAL